MTTLLHLIAQYLAAANISFVTPEKDDSHTNLGFLRGELHTHPLNPAGVTLGFNYVDFSLNWNTSDKTYVLPLDQKAHSEVLTWLEKTAQRLGFGKPYKFDFHYDLPYNIDTVSPFKMPSAIDLAAAVTRRARAHTVMSNFIQDLGFSEAIRIWPHHFDSGAYLNLSWPGEVGLGIGLAIPDSVADDFYYYMGYYKGEGAVDPNQAESLSYGKWSTQDFVGAIALQNQLIPENDRLFFSQVHSIYESQLNSPKN